MQYVLTKTNRSLSSTHEMAVGTESARVRKRDNKVTALSYVTNIIEPRHQNTGISFVGNIALSDLIPVMLYKRISAISYSVLY